VATQTLELNTVGPGIVIYSPFAMAHVAEGEDYFTSHFEVPEVVAFHVVTCRTAAAMCPPGHYMIRAIRAEAPPDLRRSCRSVIALGVEVRDRTLCVRDVGDLSRWTRTCPAPQALKIQDGFYRIVLGAERTPERIVCYMEPRSECPKLRWPGVPYLLEE